MIRGTICLVWLSAALTLGAATLTFDGGVTYQVIDGFGVNANHRSWNNDELKPVLDAFIDQAGMTLFRVVFDQANWETNNDNSDPAVMNWAAYNAIYGSSQFTPLWNMAAYLNSKGITDGLVFNFMGICPSWMGGSTLSGGMEEEWAEMIASLLVYARNTRGVQFKFVGPANEPDITGEGVHMSASQYTTALHKLAQKLDVNGLSDVRFVAPDTIGYFTTYAGAMMTDAVVMAKVGQLSAHIYGASTSYGMVNWIRGTAYPNLNLWITEYNMDCPGCDSGTRGTYDWSFCEGTARLLLNHLANNASAGLVWEGYDSSYLHGAGGWSFWGVWGVDNENAAIKTYTPRKNFYTVAQISKWVRPGAQQIGVSGSTSPFSPLLAFKHAGLGQVTIVGINTSTSAASLSGTLASLPTVLRLDLYYTSATTNLAFAGSARVADGTFSAAIPADCVFTLTGSPGAGAAITNPPGGAQFSAPATIPIIAEALTTTGSIAKVEFFAGSTRLGESLIAPYQFVWTNVPMGDYSLTAIATDTVGNHGTSAVVTVTVMGPIAQIAVSPTNALVTSGTSQPFLATAADVLGHTLNPQPVFSWSNNWGGTINSAGVFTAGSLIGGPCKVLAASGGITGTGTVQILPVAGITLGNTNDGAFSDMLWDGGAWINLSRVQAASQIIAASIQAKVGAISGSYKCSLYTDSAGTPRSLLGSSVSVSHPTNGWNTFSMVAPVVLTNAQYYWLAIWSDDTGAQVYYSNGSGSLRWGRYDYGTWPSPINTTGGNSLNYCIYIQGAAKATPPVSWPASAPIVYGTPLGATQLNATSTVPGTFTYYPPTQTLLGAGLAQPLALIFLPQDTNSYVGIITNKNLDVAQAPLLIAANSTNKVFGAPLPAFTASYSGFVNGETAAALDSPVVVSTTATAASDVGTYPLSPGGASSRNYGIQYQPGTLTVTPAATVGSLASSANPVLPTDPVTFSYSLNAVPPGAGIPTGIVYFRIDGTNAATAVPVSGGSAGYTTSALLAGRHSLRAEYGGSLDFFGTTNILTPTQLVLPRPSLSVARPEDGVMVITFNGVPGETYRVEYAPTLDTPEWLTLGTCLADDSGVAVFTNSPLQNFWSGFYRASLP